MISGKHSIAHKKVEAGKSIREMEIFLPYFKLFFTETCHILHGQRYHMITTKLIKANSTKI
jgi:hypothetical protein